MFRNTIPIQNLKCPNCAKGLKTKMLQLGNISNVLIGKDYSYISFSYISVNDLSNIENLLTHLGFPPEGEEIKHNRISYGLSCKDHSMKHCIFNSTSI